LKAIIRTGRRIVMPSASIGRKSNCTLKCTIHAIPIDLQIALLKNFPSFVLGSRIKYFNIGYLENGFSLFSEYLLHLELVRNFSKPKSVRGSALTNICESLSSKFLLHRNSISYNQCCGSGSTWIRINLAAMDPDP
jgi:hypothetical protein